MKAHGLKLELRRLRYHESSVKRVSLLPKPITFYSTIQFSRSQMIQKLDIHLIPVPSELGQSEPGNTFKKVIEVRIKKNQEKDEIANISKLNRCTLSACWKPKCHKQIIYNPQLQITEKIDFWSPRAIFQRISLSLSLSLSLFD